MENISETNGEQVQGVTPWPFIGSMFPESKKYSKFAPALAMHAGKLWCAFVDKNAADNVYYAVSDGVDEAGHPAPWSKPQWMISAGLQTPTQVALANDDSDVLHAVVIVTAQGHRDLVHYVYEDELERWAWRGGMTMHTNAYVSLCAFDNQLFCAFSPEGGGDYISYTIWDPTGGYASNWSPLVKVDARCYGAPALYPLNGALHMLYREYGTQKVYDLIYSEANRGWTRAGTQPSDSARDTISAAGMADQAYLGYLKSDGSGQVLVSTFAYNKWYQTDNDIGGQYSGTAPGLATLANTVTCAWSDKTTGELKWAQKPLGGIFPDHWMSQIAGGTKLSALTIPGTHDTCTYSSNRLWVSTQNVSLTSQLDHGIRFLDLRAGLNGGVLYMYHGDIELPGPMRLADVLGEVYNWLAEHAKETVVVSIKEDPNPVNSDGFTFEGSVLSLINAKPDYWYTADATPTLDAVRRKCVLLRRYPAKVNPDQTAIGINVYDNWPGNGTAGFTTPGGLPFYVQDYYHVDDGLTIPNAANQKWTATQAALTAANNDKTDTTWYINFTSAYSVPWGYPGALATGALGLPGFGTIPVGQGVNSKLYGWIQNKKPAVRLGIFAIDFPNQPYADLCWDIVKTNTFLGDPKEIALERAGLHLKKHARSAR